MTAECINGSAAGYMPDQIPKHQLWMCPITYQCELLDSPVWVSCLMALSADTSTSRLSKTGSMRRLARLHI